MKKMLAMAAVVCFAAAPASAADMVSWTGYTDHPNSATPEFTFLEKIAEDVKAGSKDGFAIKMVVGGSLPIKGSDVCAAVADGIIQMGVCGAATAGYLPIYDIARLPLLYDTKDELWKALDGVVSAYIDKALDKKGVKLLAMYSYPYHSVWTVNKKIEKLSDLKGLKIRTMTPPQAALIKSYGAVTVTLSTGDVAAALQHGAIDGYLTASGGAGKLWVDSVKYNYRTRLSWGPGMVAVNKEAFGKLSAGDQKLLATATKKWATWLTDTMYDDEESLTKEFVEKKGLITTPYNIEDVKEARKTAREIWQTQAKKIGPDGVEALDKVMVLLGK